VLFSFDVFNITKSHGDSSFFLTLIILPTYMFLEISSSNSFFSFFNINTFLLLKCRSAFHLSKSSNNSSRNNNNNIKQIQYNKIYVYYTFGSGYTKNDYNRDPSSCPVHSRKHREYLDNTYYYKIYVHEFSEF
jgi:hypothetical protein